MSKQPFQNVRYTGSAYKLSQLPPDRGIEIAFAGRSNAGKSSAINTITQQKTLAKTSKTPGRTQMINFFQVSNDNYLVDLPGYGYAKVTRKVREHWQYTLQRYLETREALTGLILIMDIRHPLQDLDWQMVHWCTAAQVPLHILLSKADKLSNNQAMNTLHNTVSALEQAGINATLQLFSALKRLGREDAEALISDWFQANNE